MAVTPDNTAVFVSGNIVSDDPDVFGGHAFVAEFTSAGKAKKANTWGGSLNDSASAESVVVDANGRVVTAGLAGPGPYKFGRASNSAKAPVAHLIVPAHVACPHPVDDVGHWRTVSFSYQTQPMGEATDAFALWLQR